MEHLSVYHMFSSQMIEKKYLNQVILPEVLYKICKYILHGKIQYHPIQKVALVTFLVGVSHCIKNKLNKILTGHKSRRETSPFLQSIPWVMIHLE